VQATGGAALTTSENPPETLDIEPAIPPRGDAGRRRSRALLYFGMIAPLVVGIDQLVKHLTVTNLADREPMRLLGGALYLVHVRNSGAAFSLGQGYTFVFPLVTLVVVAWIGWMVRSLASTPWAVALGLVLGGALGNLTDRAIRGAGLRGRVIDFIDFQVWPVFNLADSAIVLAAGLIILQSFRGVQIDGGRAKS